MEGYHFYDGESEQTFLRYPVRVENSDRWAVLSWDNDGKYNWQTLGNYGSKETADRMIHRQIDEKLGRQRFIDAENIFYEEPDPEKVSQPIKDTKKQAQEPIEKIRARQKDKEPVSHTKAREAFKEIQRQEVDELNQKYAPELEKYREDIHQLKEIAEQELDSQTPGSGTDYKASDVREWDEDNRTPLEIKVGEIQQKRSAELKELKAKHEAELETLDRELAQVQRTDGFKIVRDHLDKRQHDESWEFVRNYHDPEFEAIEQRIEQERVQHAKDFAQTIEKYPPPKGLERLRHPATDEYRQDVLEAAERKYKETEVILDKQLEDARGDEHTPGTAERRKHLARQELTTKHDDQKSLIVNREREWRQEKGKERKEQIKRKQQQRKNEKGQGR